MFNDGVKLLLSWEDSISDLETHRVPGTISFSFLRCIWLSELLILTSSFWNWMRDVQEDMDGQPVEWCMDLLLCLPVLNDISHICTNL